MADALHTAGQCAAEAADLLRSAGVGSTQEGDFHAVAAQWTAVQDGADELAGVVHAACEIAERYLASLGATGVPGEAAVERRDSRPVYQRHADVVRRTHQAIGPAVRGARTAGAWIRDDGSTEPLLSGKSTGWYESTVATLTEIGGRELGLGLGTHVEMQFVVRMRVEGRQHETLALDRAPCGTDPPVLLNQCHRRLPKVIGALLKPGSTLTIVSPDGQRWEYSAQGRRRL